MLDRISRRHVIGGPIDLANAGNVRHHDRDEAVYITIVVNVSKSFSARKNERDFPGPGREVDLAFALDRAGAAGGAYIDVDLLVVVLREVAEIILHVRPRTLVQV